MRQHRSAAGVSALLYLVLLFIAGVTAASAEDPSAVPGVLLIRPHNSILAKVTLQFLADLGLKGDRLVGSLGWLRVNVTDGSALEKKISLLQKLGIRAEADWIVRTSAIPNDKYWSINSDAMRSISAPAAWDLHKGTQSVSVCIIDSGVNFDHPDLQPNLDTYSYNAIKNKAGTKAARDDNGHGTHCAGTIGAMGNNRLGVTGVNWKVKLLACKFVGADGRGATSDAAECVKWCRVRGAKITSNSWGGAGKSQALEEEIKLSQDAGHLFIAAAGNDNQNIDWLPLYPAAYTSVNNVISVGALNTRTGKSASFSNYGGRNVDLFAPGVDIYSTLLASGYGWASGTSMAVPHVAGAAALLWSYKPSLGADKVKSYILQSVDALPSLKGLCASGGKLNVRKALTFSGRPSSTRRPPPQRRRSNMMQEKGKPLY